MEGGGGCQENKVGMPQLASLHYIDCNSVQDYRKKILSVVTFEEHLWAKTWEQCIGTSSDMWSAQWNLDSMINVLDKQLSLTNKHGDICSRLH